MIKTARDIHPALHDLVCSALNAGRHPDEIRRRFGSSKGRQGITYLMVDWIVDQWEREQGLVQADESIDEGDFRD